MRFDLTDLRLLVHVAAAGTITEGARRTHMTLASASERIRAMESSLGAPLLERSSRGVQPTAAGQTVLRHARTLVRQIEELNTELQGDGAELHGHVHLMCNTSAMAIHLPEALGAFLALHPRLSLELEERPSHEIVHALRHARCHIGLVSDAVDTAGLQTAIFRDDPLCVIVPRSHGLASQTRTTLGELAGLPFVGLGRDSALQRHVDQHADRLGQRLWYRMRVADLASVCRVVGLGTGVAVVPRIATTRPGRSQDIHRLALDEAWAERRLLLCTASTEPLPTPARALVAHLVQYGTPQRKTG